MGYRGQSRHCHRISMMVVCEGLAFGCCLPGDWHLVEMRGTASRWRILVEVFNEVPTVMNGPATKIINCPHYRIVK